MFSTLVLTLFGKNITWWVRDYLSQAFPPKNKVLDWVSSYAQLMDATAVKSGRGMFMQKSRGIVVARLCAPEIVPV